MSPRLSSTESREIQSLLDTPRSRLEGIAANWRRQIDQHSQKWRDSAAGLGAEERLDQLCEWIKALEVMDTMELSNMRRKPRWAEIGPIASHAAPTTSDIEALATSDIEALATELRRLLGRCRVERQARKRALAWLHGAAAMPELRPHHTDTILDLLTAALEGFAPPHSRFGQADDGAWGFWPLLDDPKLPRLTCEPLDYDRLISFGMRCRGGDAYLINPARPGAVTCGRFDRRGRFEAYWNL